MITLKREIRVKKQRFKKKRGFSNALTSRKGDLSCVVTPFAQPRTLSGCKKTNLFQFHKCSEAYQRWLHGEAERDAAVFIDKLDSRRS